jgi:hypothetical protein
MTVIEGEKIAAALVDAYLDGLELVVELTGEPVIYVGLYSRRHAEQWPFAELGTGHLHQSSEITIKGRKRGDLL